MFGTKRRGVIGIVAVLVGIAGLSYLLTSAAAPAAANQPADSGA